MELKPEDKINFPIHNKWGTDDNNLANRIYLQAVPRYFCLWRISSKEKRIVARNIPLTRAANDNTQ